MTAEFPATYLVGSSTGLIARTLLQELVDLPTSVRRFGVMGDGVTDDTAALQVALNAGIPLYFPPGTYLYSNTLTATASIIGAGWNSILQCTTPQGQNSVIYWRNASNLKIQNLQVFFKECNRLLSGRKRRIDQLAGLQPVRNFRMQVQQFRRGRSAHAQLCQR